MTHDSVCPTQKDRLGSIVYKLDIGSEGTNLISSIPPANHVLKAVYVYFPADEILWGPMHTLSHQPLQPQQPWGQVLKFQSAMDLMMKQRQVKGDLVPVNSESDSEGTTVIISL